MFLKTWYSLFLFLLLNSILENGHFNWEGFSCKWLNKKKTERSGMIPKLTLSALRRLWNPVTALVLVSTHFVLSIGGGENPPVPGKWPEEMVGSQKWAYIRIITGTILGGVLGFYVMHRVEISYKVSALLSWSFPFSNAFSASKYGFIGGFFIFFAGNFPCAGEDEWKIEEVSEWT